MSTSRSFAKQLGMITKQNLSNQTQEHVLGCHTQFNVHMELIAVPTRLRITGHRTHVILLISRSASAIHIELGGRC